MGLNWFPWKFIIRRIAKSHGFLDPVALLSQFNKFAQPSEVAAPVELLRAGLVFHARGLLNARTIQSNLDWIWPHWVQHQFDPADRAFVPRSFSVTHVNITSRNWTAVGLPDCAAFPIVDPHGLVTPFYDGWSLDGWIVAENGRDLIGPLVRDPRQSLMFDEETLRVETLLQHAGASIHSSVEVVMDEGGPVCRIRYKASSENPAFLAVALRPFNPEGVSFVHQVACDSTGTRWSVNGEECAVFDTPVEKHLVSRYRDGDVFQRLRTQETSDRQECDVGMASAAAMFRLRSAGDREVSVRVPLNKDPETKEIFPAAAPDPHWSRALARRCRLRIPDQKMQFLYEAAIRSMILHAPCDVYPGPFYYKRFWFRDAVFIAHALLCTGLHDRAERVMDQFLPRQSLSGYMESQNGEWDSNGQVLWLFRRFREITGRPCKSDWLKALIRAGKWILRKRTPATSGELHAGLFPPGFSAEHLGNNDYYYWDDFWGVAGLAAAADLCREAGDHVNAEIFQQESGRFMGCIERSLLHSKRVRNHDGIPASPYRRMDAGAVGSIVISYPLHLCPPRDPRLMNTLQFLMERCFVGGAFFQDLTHSGLNPYLSLHCAQCLLRAGDQGFMSLVERTAELASSTGQWPEAIHPQTLGGCMGDGQHVWAAAEWVMMIRNMFVREEGNQLVLLSGVPTRWVESRGAIEMGPVHTKHGPLTVKAGAHEKGIQVQWEAEWRHAAPTLVVQVMGYDPVSVSEPRPKGGMVVRPERRR